jgi:hypothetical protein
MEGTFSVLINKYTNEDYEHKRDDGGDDTTADWCAAARGVGVGVGISLSSRLEEVEMGGGAMVIKDRNYLTRLLMNLWH